MDTRTQNFKIEVTKLGALSVVYIVTRIVHQNVLVDAIVPLFHSIFVILMTDFS
jgi:hypothetical protein